MLLDENTGSVISLTEAQEYIVEFGKQYPNEVKAFFVGSNLVNSILVQEDCIGLRVYNGYDYAKGMMNQVFVGVNIDGDDMKDGVIVDKSAICPPVCPTISIMD